VWKIINVLSLLCLSVLLFFTWPEPSLAQSPNDGGGAIDVEADETGYNFEPYTYTTETAINEHIDIIDTNFINSLGSSAMTLFTLFDQIGFLGIFVVLLLALAILWRIYGFVVGEKIMSSGELPNQGNPFRSRRRRR
jgi:hypothetical protein